MAELRAETRYAKQLFLYGAGDGVPIRNAEKLSAASGVHVNTIRKHLPEWEKEAEALLSNASELGLAVRLSKETLDENERDLAFLRDKLNSLRWEIDNLDDAIMSLQQIVENFSLNTDNGDQAVRLLEDYLRSSMNRRSLLTLFLTVKKEWDSKSAIDGFREVALTREKEMQKGRAKLELKKEEQAPVREVRPLGGVFSRNEKPRLEDRDRG